MPGRTTVVQYSLLRWRAQARDDAVAARRERRADQQAAQDDRRAAQDDRWAALELEARRQDMSHAHDRHLLAMASATGGELSSRPGMPRGFFTGAQGGLERRLKSSDVEVQRQAAQQLRGDDFIGRKHDGGQVNVPERSPSPEPRW